MTIGFSTDMFTDAGPPVASSPCTLYRCLPSPQDMLLRCRPLPSAATRVTTRALAKKAAPKASSSGPQTLTSAPSDLSGVVHGLNILKDGSDPAVRPDSEYPDWVWTLCALAPESPWASYLSAGSLIGRAHVPFAHSCRVLNQSQTPASPNTRGPEETVRHRPRFHGRRRHAAPHTTVE